MQAKLNIVLKLVDELGFSIKGDSPLLAVSNLDDNDRLRLSLTELIEEYEISEDLLDEISGKLNDIKKKNFELAILEIGRKIGSPIELKELKSRGVEKLVTIPSEAKNHVLALESHLHQEQAFLAGQRKKSKDTHLVDWQSQVVTNDRGQVWRMPTKEYHFRRGISICSFYA